MRGPMSNYQPTVWKGSTILTVRKGNQVVIAGEGQITEGGVILNSHVKNVRRLTGDVVCGFTGKMADALMLFEKLESLVTQSPHQLTRACVDLAKFWRQSPHLSNIDAMMLVVNANHSLLLTGTGDVLERGDGIIGIGAAGPYALAAAHALYDIESLSASEIVEKSMNIAADICIYSNKNIIFEKIEI